MNTVYSNFSSLTKWQKIYVCVLTGLFAVILGFFLFLLIRLSISAGGFIEFINQSNDKNRSNISLVIQFAVIFIVLGAIWRNKVYFIFKKEKILEFSEKEFLFYYNINYLITFPVNFKLISAAARLSTNQIRVNFSEIIHHYKLKNYRNGTSLPASVNEIKISGNAKDLDQLEVTLKILASVSNNTRSALNTTI